MTHFVRTLVNVLGSVREKRITVRKRCPGVLCAFLLIAMLQSGMAWGQIALGGKTGTATQATSVTWTYNVNSGANLVLVGIALSAGHVEQVKFGDQSLSCVIVAEDSADSSCMSSGSYSLRSEIWVLPSPAITSGQITITLSTAADVAAGSVAYAGVDLAGGNGIVRSARARGDGDIIQLTMDTLGCGNCLVVDSVATGNYASNDTSQSKIWANASNNTYWMSSSEGNGTADSVVMYHWMGEGATPWAQTAVLLKSTTPTLVTLDRFTATPQDGGVLLQWRTGREVSNLGFNIYRSGVRVTSSPVAGSALLAGARTVLTAGNSYSWFDPDGTASSSYTLEDIDLNGSRTMHGPVQASGFTASAMFQGRMPKAPRGTSPLLTQIGRGTAVSSNAVLLSRESVSRPVRGHSDAVQQAALAGGAGVKIGVKTEGWYRVDASQLIAAGMPAGADPRRLQLFTEGCEQAIVVRGGGKVESIEFYGTGIDTTFSDTRVYWLTWDGRSGARADSSNARAEGAAAVSFAASLEWLPRSLYFPALINGDADNFFGPAVALASKPSDLMTQTLPVAHLSRGPAALQVTMQGVTTGDHTVTVQVNGRDLGVMTLEGQANSSATFPIPDGLLREGDNTLSLSTNKDDDITLVDSVVLTYPRGYTADSDSLRFTAASGASVTVGGFTSDQIQVVDVTNPSEPVLMLGNVISQGAGYAVSFGAAGGGERTLMAFTTARESQPASVAANHPSSWRARQAGADMVIIRPAAFAQSVEPLEALRKKQHHKVALVDVEDIYDEFSFGEQTPYAIKNFLANANSVWAKKPHWVLLVGDATCDPRDYLQSGQVDYVPVELVGTSQLETASDDWFVDFNDDGLPEMAIGRLPAGSPAAASLMVGRIVAYEQAGEADWKKKALLVSGKDDSENRFSEYTSEVQGMLPLAVTKVVAGNDPGADQTAIVAAINSGVGLVNYAGHGSTEVWDGVFDSTAAETLTNDNKTPFVIAMSCLNGYFQDVYTTSLADALLSAPAGGAVGVWASTSLTDSRSQAALNQAMIGALYGGLPMTVGDAALAAKNATTNVELRKTYLLFGDPAMNLR